MFTPPPHVGAELRAERLRRGLTLDDVAHNICSYSYLSLVESGKRNPSAGIETALRARLGMATGEAADLFITNVDYQMAFIEYRRQNLESWNALMDRLPDDSNEKVHLQAIADEHHGNLERALALNLDILDSNPTPTEFHIKVAISTIRTLITLGDYPRAIEVFTNVTEHHNDVLHRFPSMHIELWAMIAGVFAETNQVSNALAALRRLATLKPADSEDSINAHWGSADAYRAMGLWPEAEHHTVELLRIIDAKKYPTKWAFNVTNLISIQLYRGSMNHADMIAQQREALHTLHARDSSEMELHARLNLALLCALVGDSLAAHAELFGITEHLAHNPSIELGETHVGLARVYQALGETPLALDALSRATQLLDDSPNTRTSAIAWRTMADLYERAGDPVAAASCLKGALDRLGIRSTLEVVPLVFDPSMP